MSKKMSRLRAHKLAVKTAARRANKRDAHLSAHRDGSAEAPSRRETHLAERSRRREHADISPSFSSRAATSSTSERRKADVDARTAGTIVQRLLGDMALDAEDKALASVQLAAKSKSAKLKRPREDSEQGGLKEEAAVLKRKRQKVDREGKKKSSPSPAFAIPLEGDGDEEDVDMSREIAMAASQFVTKLKPHQQATFWSLRGVAQGTRAPAAASESKLKSAPGQKRSDDVEAKVAQRKMSKTGSGAADENDDLSFGYLMNAPGSSKKGASRQEDERDDDTDSEAFSTSSDSSSEPSWIPESDDDVDEEDFDDEEEEDEDENSEAFEEVDDETALRNTTRKGPSESTIAAASKEAGKRGASAKTERVTVHRQPGRGGRLFGLDADDNTWDD